MAEGAGNVPGNREVFVDTGYLLALERRTDQNHPRALEHRRSLGERGLPRLVSTTYVFDETVTYLNARWLHASAVKVGNRLLASLSVELVHVGEDLFRRAFDLLGLALFPNRLRLLRRDARARDRDGVRLRPTLRAGGVR